MKGKETFKALAEEKVVFCPYTGELYMVDEFGELRHKHAGSGRDWALVCSTGSSLWTEEYEVMKDYTEYVYTFREAMRLMLLGHRMENEVNPECVYRFDEFGRFLQHALIRETATLSAEEVEAKWRVVE